MPPFNKESAQAFQSSIVSRVRELQRMIDQDVVHYYTRDRVDDERDYYENLRGLSRFLGNASQRIDGILRDIRSRL